MTFQDKQQLARSLDIDSYKEMLQFYIEGKITSDKLRDFHFLFIKESPDKSFLRNNELTRNSFELLEELLDLYEPNEKRRSKYSSNALEILDTAKKLLEVFPYNN